MAATSPRCIQHLHSHPTSHLVKPSPSSPAASPNSALTTPSSYDSELDPPTLITDHKPEHSSHTALSNPSPNSASLTPSSTSPHTNPKLTNPTNWVATLLSTKFYGPCPLHHGVRKNDQNLFCVQHAVKICQYCHHADHPQKHTSNPCTILHVSRYMYHDVLLAKEASALLDIAEVQSYLNNGNRVVYIDRRAQPKSKLAPHAKACVVCSRTLQDPYQFCSLFCRLQHAKDPAALDTLPVPDATPLAQPVAKKPKKSSERDASHTYSPPKKHERACTRLDRSASSSPRTTVVPARKAAMDHATSIRLNAIKKNRRKGKPSRSILLSQPSWMIAPSIIPMHS